MEKLVEIMLNKGLDEDTIVNVVEALLEEGYEEENDLSLTESILQLFEEYLYEGRQKGETLPQYKERLARELKQKFETELPQAEQKAAEEDKKSEVLGKIHHKTFNHSSSDPHRNPPRYSKAGAKLEKAIRTFNSWAKQNDKTRAAERRVNTLNKNLKRINQIQNNEASESLSENCFNDIISLVEELIHEKYGAWD